MFAIQPTNRFYKEHRYVGVRSDTELPYLIYETSQGFPNDIHDFETLEAAKLYLKKIVEHIDIDVTKLSTSQMVDLALVNNANKFDIIQYTIEDNKLCITATYPQPQYSRKDWY